MKKLDKVFYPIMALYMLILLVGLVISSAVDAATCTTITRPNFTTNQVLTSSDLNSQLNNIYAPFNSSSPGALDAGCIVPGSLESDSLNATDFAVPLNYIREGCLMTKSNASTLSIDKCALSVNGNFVRTTTATTISFSCSGCSAEVASQDFYVFAKSDSDGSTLNLLILDGAPNNDGYDSSSNRIIGKFHNDGSSNIATDVDNWFINQFGSELTKGIAYLSDVKPTGTRGGTCTGGSSYATRDLNTIDDNNGIIKQLALNQFTVTAGTYHIGFAAPAFQTNGHKAKLQNITLGTTAILGSNRMNGASVVAVGTSIGYGTVTFGTTTILEIQHNCQTTAATSGFGEVGSGDGDVEIYTWVRVQKVN